jgi:deazaflavin-dependent oxidoreductase (nitroreductase family)
MTVQQQELRTPPRFLIRTFWLLHRTAYRLTRGRFGLAQPAAGERFGYLRLHTVGRRSGKARVAIVGYYEDGSNLVTLAMNGWGATEPAWWLNLQATPETTVQLADGARSVRARAATESERERLWPKFADYPGWGDDLEALAARRPGQTAIVVFEPTAGAGRKDEVVAVAAADGAMPLDRAGASEGRRLRLRHLWIVPGLALAIVANQLGTTNGVGILALIAFGIAPDVPRLFGSRGRPLHNLTHHPIVAAAAVAVTAVAAPAMGVVPVVWLVASLVWFSHVVIGRAVGDVHRSESRHDA